MERYSVHSAVDYYHSPDPERSTARAWGVHSVTVGTQRSDPSPQCSTWEGPAPPLCSDLQPLGFGRIGVGRGRTPHHCLWVWCDFR